MVSRIVMVLSFLIGIAAFTVYFYPDWDCDDRALLEYNIFHTLHIPCKIKSTDDHVWVTFFGTYGRDTSIEQLKIWVAADKEAR